MLVNASNKSCAINLQNNASVSDIRKIIDNYNYEYYVFLGGINKCNISYQEVSNLLNKNILYVLDKYDILRLKQLTSTYSFDDEFKFLSSLPINVSVYYPTQITFTILSGGITTNIKSQNDFDYSICFNDYINNKSWHDYYDGRFGKILSNYPDSIETEPKLYNHSINLNNINNSTYIQEINKFGLEDTIRI